MTVKTIKNSLVSAGISGLDSDTTYHFRAKGLGTSPGYGADQTFATPPTCGDWGYLEADFNTDCVVNLKDVGELAGHWLEGTDP